MWYVPMQNFTEGVTYDNVPYPKDMLMAVANVDADYPGSCGRCYEVRYMPTFKVLRSFRVLTTVSTFDLVLIGPGDSIKGWEVGSLICRRMLPSGRKRVSL